MEIRIGVQNVAREVVVQSEQNAADVQKLVDAAIESGAPLRLEDSSGHLVTVPGSAIGYVDIGAETRGRVGFGG